MINFFFEINGIEVEVTGKGYEHSPEINFIGFDELLITDLDGNAIDISDEDYERIHIQACQVAEDQE